MRNIRLIDGTVLPITRAAAADGILYLRIVSGDSVPACMDQIDTLLTQLEIEVEE